MEDKIKIGISRCLLGENVRYDGGHKKDYFITDTLGRYIEFVPVCPEVECGLGVPREAMHLEGNPGDPRLVTIRTKIDHTDRMKEWARRRIAELEKEGLCGFIFKSGSPSSGMERVRVYGEKGGPSKTGVGLFAREFMSCFPLLPVEDEGRLHDPQLRENFIERIFALKRWREVSIQKTELKSLIDFHTSHKFLILSHSRPHYQRMGQLVARPDDLPLKERFTAYQPLFLEALRIKTTPKKHTDVLMHLMGFFKKDLSSDEKQELLEVIDHYKLGLIPLVVPVTLLRHYVRKYNQLYLENQWYLEPHPLAGGIAHDFNNILTAIMGYAELSLFDLPKGNSSQNHISQVLKATGRAKDLVQQILTFSRQSEQEDRPIQISQVAKEVLKLLRASLPSTIEIKRMFQKETDAVLADPTQIQQVILNLCTNAAYAMREKGGVLDVSVEDIEMDVEQSLAIPGMNPGLYIKITVKDTGQGMAPEIMEHIFEPYFTTKEKEMGTGLGLAVVHGIIKRLKGHILVESSLEEGTTFSVFFPKIEGPAAEIIEPLTLPPLGHERILIVDDEEVIVTLEQEMLQRLGYSVVSRTSPLEALEVFRANPQRFDLVITDQTMPFMTGEHLAQTLIEIRPDIPIILCTGYSALVDEIAAKGLGIKKFVMKPIILQDLARIIRKVLDEK